MGGVNLVDRVPARTLARGGAGDAPAGRSTVRRGRRRPGRLHDAGHAARRGALALRQRLRRRLRPSLGGDRRAGAVASVADETVELAVPPRPRPHRLHRRHREPDAGRRPGRRAGPRRHARRRRDASCCCRSGVTTPTAWESLAVDRQEQAIGRTKSTAWSSRTSRTTPTSRAPIRTTSARSSGATCRTAPSPTTARCSSASAAEQRPLARDAREHGRADDGDRDALTRFTTPLTGRVLLRPVDAGSPRRRRGPRRRTEQRVAPRSSPTPSVGSSSRTLGAAPEDAQARRLGQVNRRRCERYRRTCKGTRQGTRRRTRSRRGTTSESASRRWVAVCPVTTGRPAERPGDRRGIQRKLEEAAREMGKRSGGRSRRAGKRSATTTRSGT